MKNIIIFVVILLFVVSFCYSQTNQQKYLRYIEERKSPSTAMILSILIPGGGHFYNGDTHSGILFGSIRIGLIGVAFLFDTDGRLVFLSLAAGLTCCDAAEAAANAKEINNKLREKYHLSIELSGNRIGLAYHF